jgi:hypothetical protein
VAAGLRRRRGLPWALPSKGVRSGRREVELRMLLDGQKPQRLNEDNPQPKVDSRAQLTPL